VKLLTDAQTSVYEPYMFDRVSGLLAKAQDYFAFSFICHQVSTKLRGRAAGQYQARKEAGLTRHLIRVNGSLLLQHGHDFLNEVLTHECAHLVVYQYYGRQHQGLKVRPHGWQWQAVMTQVFSASAHIYHQYEDAKANTNTFRYRCQCASREHHLSLIRHNKVQRGKAQYMCRDCRAQLVIADSA